MLNWGLKKFDTIRITQKDEIFGSLDVWLGKKSKVKTYLKNNVYKTIPKARKKYLKVVVNYNGPIEGMLTTMEVLAWEIMGLDAPPLLKAVSYTHLTLPTKRIV